MDKIYNKTAFLYIRDYFTSLEILHIIFTSTDLKSNKFEWELRLQCFDLLKAKVNYALLVISQGFQIRGSMKKLNSRVIK